MKILFWNVRGLANSPSKLALKRLLKQNKPTFLLIAEPWISYDSFPQRWLARLGFKLFAVNDRSNMLPNLWCICSSNINPLVISNTNQQVSFLLRDQGKDFGVSAIYASTNYLHRRNLWQTLNLLQTQHNIPWCFIGDYNAIVGAHEYGGSHNPSRIPIEDFLNWSESNHLIHIPTRGSLFTWANGRRGSNFTEKRLDRSICNNAWIDMCSSVSCRTLTKQRSDHFPILLEFYFQETSFASQFKFMQMWSLHPNCSALISKVWNTPVVGCPMFILNRKLKMLKEKLKEWNKNIFGNVTDNVKVVEDLLKHIQDQLTASGPSEVLLDQEREAQLSLENALKIEEVFWQDKARVKWHAEGDRNTRYFHRLAKIKNTTRPITSIRHENTTINDQEQIANHVVNHYTNLFNVCSVLQDDGIVEEVIPNIVSDQTNNLLTMLPTPEEIFSAVTNLKRDSAPGPNGFGAFFFHKYWSIIKADVINVVSQFFSDEWILPNYNSNTIVLIPKQENADSIDQFRPIALANFKHKILTKILADRLAQIMPTIISKEQRAFIHGRNIRDCICLTSEVVNLLHNKCFGGNVAMKIDISKAFDIID